MRLKKGTLISNRYEIAENIGSGGMAIVYKALDLKLNRTVTLKIMREEYIEDEEFINRFNIEAQAAANLNHINIVKVYDVGRHDNIYYIVMEYINGITLKEAIKKKGMLSNEEVLGVAIQIASGLAHAHDNKIIHRDIKPQNILITSRGEVKVTDFGIARATNKDTKTATTSTLGSVHYFSPEQARGGFIDNKSDIYALGITMFEMATGFIPFDDDTVVAIALKHINEPMPYPHDANPDILISEEVENVIMKCTKKLQGQRYKDAVELVNELKHILSSKNTKKQIKDTGIDGTHTLKMSKEEVEAIQKKARKDDFNDDFHTPVVGVKHYDRYSNNDDRQYDDYEDEYYEDDYGYEEEKGNKGYILYAVITGVVLSFIIIFIMFSMVTNKDVDIPDLSGLTLVEAETLALEEEFELKVNSEEHSDIVPKGQIIEQNYMPGDTLEKGQTIQVKVSLGTDKVEIPNYVGKDVNSINAGSFTVKIEEEFSSEHDKGVIFNQNPKSGEMLSPKDTLTLYVSKGEEQKFVTVPSVVGTSEASAIDTINNKDLKVGNIIHVYSDSVNKGIVISQSLSANSQVKENTVINITISKGPEPQPEPEPEVPEESVEPEEPEVPEEPIVKQKLIKVSNVDVPTGFETVVVRVDKIDTESMETVYEEILSINDFPIEIPVSGTGVAEFQVFIKYADYYDLHGSSKIDFDN